MLKEYRYRAFGLEITSNLELPTLVPAENREEREPADRLELRVLRGEIAPPTPFQDASEPWLRGRFPGGFLFEARPGRIEIWVPEGYEDDLIRTYLLGYIIGVSLRLRGRLVLHAASVAVGDQAVAFVGRSGWGKSTLAAHFVKRGYDLLADDLTAVSFDSAGPPVVHPGLSHIRLYRDTGERLLPSYEGLPLLNAHSEKRVGYLPPQDDRPRQLAKVYVLEGTFGDSIATEPLSPAEAFPHLAAHTRAMHEFNESLLRLHLDQAARLLRSVPVSVLRRKRSLEALDEVASLVEEEVGLPAPAAVPS